jgi:cAMP phosphodiesterase
VIDHIFITHSHLDHIACMPLLIDSVGFMRDHPLTIYVTEETLEILRAHVFNWKVWPDFTQIPNARNPYMRFQTIAIGETVDLGGRRITPIPAVHTVPAVGFHLDSGSASLIFSGDTTANDALWDTANRIENLRYLIIETAFSDNEKKVAILSKHLFPSMLAEELLKFRGDAEVFITHLKPGEVELTMRQIEKAVHGRAPKMLLNNQEFEF